MNNARRELVAAVAWGVFWGGIPVVVILAFLQWPEETQAVLNLLLVMFGD